MASAISTATPATTTTPVSARSPVPPSASAASPAVKKSKKDKQKKRKEKGEKEEKEKKNRKRERETKRVSPPKTPVVESDNSDNSDSSSDSVAEREEEDLMEFEEIEENSDEVKSPKNVEAEVQELLNGEERDKVIAMAKEHEKAEKRIRQQARDDLKKLTDADDKKLQALFKRQETLSKSADVALLRQLKTQKSDLERRILNQEEKSDVINFKKTEKDIRALRVEMRKKYAQIAKEKGLRYAVPNGIRKERKPVKKARADQCFVCYDAEPNCALAPCGHTMCFGCAQEVHECPMCRARITMKVKIIKN